MTSPGTDPPRPSVDDALIEVLCCPTERVPVRRATESELAALNSAIAGGDLARADGSRVEAPLQEALVTRDGKRVYPVEDEIPVLMAEAAIPTDRIGGWPEADSGRS